MEVSYVVPYFSSEFSRLALNNIQYNYEDINLYIDMLFMDMPVRGQILKPLCHNIEITSISTIVKCSEIGFNW